MLRRSLLASSAALLASPAVAQTSGTAGKTLRVVMQSDLKILDPAGPPPTSCATTVTWSTTRCSRLMPISSRNRR